MAIPQIRHHRLAIEGLGVFGASLEGWKGPVRKLTSTTTASCPSLLYHSTQSIYLAKKYNTDYKKKKKKNSKDSRSPSRCRFWRHWTLETFKICPLKAISMMKLLQHFLPLPFCNWLPTAQITMKRWELFLYSCTWLLKDQLAQNSYQFCID